MITNIRNRNLDQGGRIGGHSKSSPPPMNTSKLHLHVEQCSQNHSLKTSWRTPIQPKVQERFPCNQDRQTKGGSGPPALGRVWKEEKVCMGGPSPWGASRSSHRLGSPVWGPTQRKQAPLATGRTAGTEGWRSLDSSWRVRGCWVANNQSRESSALASYHLATLQAGWTPQPHPPHTTAWCRTWARQVLGKTQRWLGGLGCGRGCSHHLLLWRHHRRQHDRFSLPA